MSHVDWRMDRALESEMGRFLRYRWHPDSVFVLDIDHLICDPKMERPGLLIEEKHVDAKGRNARVTREIARRLGWYSSLMVYRTNGYMGDVTEIDATIWTPSGKEIKRPKMDFRAFDEFICNMTGARMPS